ncbi:acyltransferase domain-containing protein [Nocardia stercoris]|uniref:Acyltransferase domain-containing protein n=1 Tax=Nocardia stercoris TaxID=2483361 RepID=A0A3M2L8X3_9NOCA|nr:acyltransferase domain-containing protein [Nocardia stercoris]RMI34027.1 acyltransferase domain-containing protein [Nocardia stercoris]
MKPPFTAGATAPLLLFAGGGGLQPRLGRMLAARYPVFARALDAAADAVTAAGGPRVWTPRYGFGRSIDDPRAAEPALFTYQVAMAELLRACGIRPAALIGYGPGEVAAAAVAGALSWTDAARLAVVRGWLLARHPSAAAMLAAPAEEVHKLVQPLRGEVAVAAVHGSRSVLVTGAPGTIGTVLRRARRRGMAAQELARAGHQPWPVLDNQLFIAELGPLRADSGAVPIYSTTRLRTGAATGRFDAGYWADHGSGPVELPRALDSAARDGFSTVVEIGPAAVPAVRTHPAFRAGIQAVTGGADEASTLLDALEQVRHRLYPSATPGPEPTAAPPVAATGAPEAFRDPYSTAVQPLPVLRPGIPAGSGHEAGFRDPYPTAAQPLPILPTTSESNSDGPAAFRDPYPTAAQPLPILPLAPESSGSGSDPYATAAQPLPTNASDPNDPPVFRAPYSTAAQPLPILPLAPESGGSGSDPYPTAAQPLPIISTTSSEPGEPAVLRDPYPTAAQPLPRLGDQPNFADPYPTGVQQLPGATTGSDLESCAAAPQPEQRLRPVLHLALGRPNTPDHARTPHPVQVEPDGTYVVTEGLGPLGAAAARWLLTAGAHDVVVLTRNPDSLPPLLSGWEDRVVVVGCEVGDRADLAAAIDDIRSCGSIIRGLVHGLQLHHPDAHDADESERIAADLLDLTDTDPIDFMVLFAGPGPSPTTDPLVGLARAHPDRRLIGVGRGMELTSLDDEGGAESA